MGGLGPEWLSDLIQAKEEACKICSQSESSNFFIASSIAGTALRNASHCSTVILIPALCGMLVKK